MTRAEARNIEIESIPPIKENVNMTTKQIHLSLIGKLDKPNLQNRCWRWVGQVISALESQITDEDEIRKQGCQQSVMS